MPDTSSLTLNHLAGTDPARYAGLEDGVDWHWDRIFSGRDSAQASINQVGQEMTRRNMNTQPTLTGMPGLLVRFVVNRDLVLRPYQPLLFNRGTS